MFNGADPDKTAVAVMFSRFRFENTLFLVDRGFNTDKDKALFSGNGNTYIVPMILKGLKVIKERDRYVVRNDNKQRKQLCEKLGINLSKHGVTDSPT